MADGVPALSVGSAPLCEKMEISDAALNTAFGLIGLRGVGDAATAARLDTYARTQFAAGWHGPEFAYMGAPRTLHSTALYTLAGLVDGEGTLLHRLFHAPRDPALATQPCLDRVTLGDRPAPDSMGIAEAAYDPGTHTLALATTWLGDAPPPADPVHLHCERIPAVQRVLCDGQAWDAWAYELGPPRVGDPRRGRRFATLHGATGGVSRAMC